VGTSVTNEHLIQEDIKRRLNSGNACYYSVQNLLYSRVLSKNNAIRIIKTVIFPVVYMGVKHVVFDVREEQGAEENIWIKKFEQRRGCRTLHNEELPNLYCMSSLGWRD
jgi:hypothetical protein